MKGLLHLHLHFRLLRKEAKEREEIQSLHAQLQPISGGEKEGATMVREK